MLVSHLNMNGITSLNYPKVAFESWSLPVPGRKTLGLTCAGFVSSGFEIQMEIVVVIIITDCASQKGLKQLYLKTNTFYLQKGFTLAKV